MADTFKQPYGDLALTGEYLKAMETASAHLMCRLPDNEELWRILGQTEALLLEAQMSGTPLTTLFGKGGVAGFCQSIIDEKAGPEAMTSPPPQARKKSRASKPRKTTNSRIRKKKNVITASVILLWLLLVAILVGQYTGFLSYLWNPHSFYLEELHNFAVTVKTLEGSEASVSVPLVSQSVDPRVLYEADGYRVILTYVGFDEDKYSVDQPKRRWYAELAYTQVSSFSEITYVSPAESGSATVTLPDGESVSQSLYWQGSGYYENGTAYVRLYFADFPADEDTAGAVADISFAPMTYVRWQRTGVGSQAK